MDDVYIGRQPILNSYGEIFAYELLFRSGGDNFATIESDLAATARVIVNTLVNLGVNKIVGGKFAFINLNDTILKNKVYSPLDKNKFIFEILETTVLDAETVNMIQQMKDQGYRFALDDFLFTNKSMDYFKPVLDKIEFLKVDIRGNTLETIKNKIGMVKHYPVKLLAEKVETDEEFKFLKKLGFDYFQGYFFAKPTIIKGKGIDPDKMAVMELFGVLEKNPDADTKDIEEIFKKYPDMTINLLKFINSAAFFTRSKINSVRQAIALLGINKLMQWLLLMLYAGPQNRTTANPLYATASQRAKFMELLVKKSGDDSDRALTDEAYLVGLLSLLDVLFQIPLDKILMDMNLSQDIQEAITGHKGTLGQMLLLVEKAELQRTMEIELILKQMQIPLADFSDAALGSFVYTESMTND